MSRALDARLAVGAPAGTPTHFSFLTTHLLDAGPLEGLARIEQALALGTEGGRRPRPHGHRAVELGSPETKPKSSSTARSTSPAARAPLARITGRRHEPYPPVVLPRPENRSPDPPHAGLRGLYRGPGDLRDPGCQVGARGAGVGTGLTPLGVHIITSHTVTSSIPMQEDLSRLSFVFIRERRSYATRIQPRYLRQP